MVATVIVHSSQFPDQVQHDLLHSLRSRQVNHKFHYDTIKQTNRWLALHQAYSPSRNDADCAATYDYAFASSVALVAPGPVHLVGLGCGGGQKDTRLLRLLKASGHELYYTPADVSSAMTLVARQAALECLPAQHCSPFVCDFAAADLEEAFRSQIPAGVTRLVTFFGMIPNFEPAEVVRILKPVLRPGDILLLSANLAPGLDYSRGMMEVLPQYDNLPTREWLMTFLQDLGVEPGDGTLEFTIEQDPAGSGLQRINATFRFAHPRRLTAYHECFDFIAGDRIRLFYSYRYTPERVRSLLVPLRLRPAAEHLAASGQEGVFVFLS